MRIIRKTFMQSVTEFQVITDKDGGSHSKRVNTLILPVLPE
jgi:hypothetical protein